ncbi:hypothetical protein OB03_00330 [Brevundimonas sp. GN22]
MNTDATRLADTNNVTRGRRENVEQKLCCIRLKDKMVIQPQLEAHASRLGSQVARVDLFAAKPR